MKDIHVQVDGDPRLVAVLIDRGIQATPLYKPNMRAALHQLALQASLASLAMPEALISYTPDRTNKPAYRDTLPRRQSRY